MAKIALLIGVQQYGHGLTPLPSASNDVEAMNRVLQDPNIGGFDEVIPLIDPEPTRMGTAIQALFDRRKKGDLVVLYFSGHGVKDDNGRLYLSTSLTAREEGGGLIKATAIPASFIHDLMNHSRAKQQVIILDCCFSGAFADGLSAKDDGAIAIKQQLLEQPDSPSGELTPLVDGRVVLTSASATQYAFEQGEAALSVYTQYLVEGLSTGAADQDNDEVISIDELHEFAAKKVQEAAPAMKPEIYAIKQGYKIQLAKALIDDPKLKYRKEAERFSSHGQISPAGRAALDNLRRELQLTAEDTNAIEAETLKPYREYRHKLEQYGRVYRQMLRPAGELSNRARDDLTHLQRVLKLRDADVKPLEAYIRRKYYSAPAPTPTPAPVEMFVLPAEPVPSTVSLIKTVARPESARSGQPIAKPDKKADKGKSRRPVGLTLATLAVISVTGLGLSVRQQCQWPNVLSCFVNQLSPAVVREAIDAVDQSVALTHAARTRAMNSTDWQASRLRKEWKAIAFNWEQAIALLDQAMTTIGPDHPDYGHLQELSQIAQDELAYANAVVNSVTATQLAQANRNPHQWQDILSKEQWQAIILLWEEAIAHLDSISSDNSETFQAAQSLINRYRDELSIARQAQDYAPLRRALAIAHAAEQLQSAQPQSASEWLRIASLWDQAVDELEQVESSTSDYYTKAQARLPLYRTNLTNAKQKASA